MAHAEQAVYDAHIGTRSSAFIKVTDANIFVAGLVGGFGGHLGKSVGAHSFFNAATSVPEIHSVLHGSQVAYGILVQLGQKTEEIEKLLPFYQSIGLPSSLADLHLDKAREETLTQIAERMAQPCRSQRRH
ncbi:iron-containing alcohol dehydrogenase [Desmospora activa]|uniref:iron-containing alcohol dehydrogenase n=1 Tax=Desmospora activa TaxID=500615 RepID=UPI0014726FA9|nr:iron-containing alcohol dehydrogenase [Desmospora activa]